MRQLQYNCSGDWLRDEKPYNLMRWDDEAKRLTAAFGITSRCWFVNMGAIGKRLRTGDNRKNSRIYLPNGCRITAAYFTHSRYLTISTHDSANGSASIGMTWDGTILSSVVSEHHTATLGKALYCLDLLTEEVNKLWELDFSAHECLEWQLEYEERMKEFI